MSLTELAFMNKNAFQSEECGFGWIIVESSVKCDCEWRCHKQPSTSAANEPAMKPEMSKMQITATSVQENKSKHTRYKRKQCADVWHTLPSLLQVQPSDIWTDRYKTGKKSTLVSWISLLNLVEDELKCFLPRKDPLWKLAKCLILVVL